MEETARNALKDLDGVATALKDYEVTIKMLMPSHVKETEYKLQVKAVDMVRAHEQAIIQWDAATDPKNVTIREKKAGE